MTAAHHAWQTPAISSAWALRRASRLRRPSLGAARRWTVWLAMAACLGVLMLLLAFQRVVLHGVQQSDSRHRASAAHTDGVWRCGALRGVSERAECRVQNDAARAAAAVYAANH